MILVSVGTNEARFDRLLEWFNRFELDEEVVIQHGPSAIRPHGARCVAYMPYEELAGLIRQSRAFVTHAGVGSIMVSLASQHRPVVVPRLKRFDEAVDDHQVALARRLGDENLVTHVDSADGLERALATAEHGIAAAVGATALQHHVYDYLVTLRSRSC